MKICIRKEANGILYIDKTAISRFTEEQLKQPPYNYSLVEIDDKYIDCETEDFDLINEVFSFNVFKYKTRKETRYNYQHIETLKQFLENTDYKAIKFAEGEISEEEYEPIKQQRKAWRLEINELQNQLPNPAE